MEEAKENIGETISFEEFLEESKIPNKETLQAMDELEKHITEKVTLDELKEEAKKIKMRYSI